MQFVAHGGQELVLHARRLRHVLVGGAQVGGLFLDALGEQFAFLAERVLDALALRKFVERLLMDGRVVERDRGECSKGRDGLDIGCGEVIRRGMADVEQADGVPVDEQCHAQPVADLSTARAALPAWVLRGVIDQDGRVPGDDVVQMAQLCRAYGHGRLVHRKDGALGHWLELIILEQHD